MLRFVSSTTILLSTIVVMLPLHASATMLAVPFTSQSPRGIWIEPWQNACEETVTIMVDHFYKGDTSLSTHAAETSILWMYNTKTRRFGWSLDENASTIVQWINDYLPWEAHVVETPTIAMMQAEIDAGRPIILPVYAPYLSNPFFSGFFAYHTIVLSGYDDEKKVFITQEPGTRRGANFTYSYETILKAMHDFVPGGTHTSRQVAIFTENTITNRTANSDADNDGLSKQHEIEYGTDLTAADTDGDGYTDGAEVARGFSPTSNELADLEGSLIKHPTNPMVYLVEGNKKRHIRNEVIFLANGWQWDQIRYVSNGLLAYLETGSPVL